MLFKIISDEKNEFDFLDNGEIIVYHKFENVLINFPNADYFQEKISDNIYWSNDLSVFISDFLKDYQYEKIPLVDSISDFEIAIETLKEFFCLKEKKVYIFNKEYVDYFNQEKPLCKLSTIEKKIRSKNFSFSIESFRNYCDENKLEFGVLLLTIYDKFYKTSGVNPSVSNIIFCRNFFNQNKIYNFLEEGKKIKEKNLSYSIFNSTESNTGRLFCKELQTLNTQQKQEFEALKGCYLVEFDFKAFEYNILSDVLKIKKQEDPHQFILDYLGLIDVDRDIGKKINYSYIYGMSLKKLCAEIYLDSNLRIDENKLSEFPIFKEKPNIKIEDNFIFSYFNRKIKVEKEYAILNNFIQATGADIFFEKVSKIIKIFPETIEDRIISQSHDSILFQFSEKTIEETNILEKIKEILEKPVDIFTFSTKIKYGKNLNFSN